MLMLESSFHGLRALALDGVAGKYHSLLFDDRDWAVRHIAIRAGSRLSGHIALLSPAAVTVPARALDRIEVHLKQEELKHCPDINAAKPVSLQEEDRLQNMRAVIGFTYDGFSSALMVPTAETERELAEVPEAALAGGDRHLRSTKGVRHYQVRLQSGEKLGSVEDFVVDVTRWKITHTVIRLHGWPHPRRIVVPSDTMESVSWFDQAITARLSPQTGRKKRLAGTRHARPRPRRREKTLPRRTDRK
jgi:sporulation protein YlmC with PRC-barrel domain